MYYILCIFSLYFCSSFSGFFAWFTFIGVFIRYISLFIGDADANEAKEKQEKWLMYGDIITNTLLSAWWLGVISDVTVSWGEQAIGN